MCVYGYQGEQVSKKSTIVQALLTYCLWIVLTIGFIFLFTNTIQPLLTDSMEMRSAQNQNTKPPDCSPLGCGGD